jgi:hypothetical protein
MDAELLFSIEQFHTKAHNTYPLLINLEFCRQNPDRTHRWIWRTYIPPKKKNCDWTPNQMWWEHHHSLEESFITAKLWPQRSLSPFGNSFSKFHILSHLQTSSDICFSTPCICHTSWLSNFTSQFKIFHEWTKHSAHLWKLGLKLTFYKLQFRSRH